MLRIIINKLIIETRMVISFCKNNGVGGHCHGRTVQIGLHARPPLVGMCAADLADVGQTGASLNAGL